MTQINDSGYVAKPRKIMNPHLSFLLLPYTRFKLPGWARLMRLAGNGAVLGGAERMSPEWSAMPKVTVRGKRHCFKMKLNRSDWAQCSTYFLGRYYELGVQRTLDKILRNGETFVDIGGNIGMISLHARYLVGSDGKLICFEPNPECADVIEEHMRMNDIDNTEVRRCALAEAPGTLSLNLTSAHTGTATLASVTGAVRSMKVAVCVGDDELAGKVPRLLKIDVEGFELQVLKGFKKQSLGISHLLLRSWWKSTCKAGSSSAGVLEFLTQLGYKPSGIGTVRSPIRHDVKLSPMTK